MVPLSGCEGHCVCVHRIRMTIFGYTYRAPWGPPHFELTSDTTSIDSLCQTHACVHTHTTHARTHACTHTHTQLTLHSPPYPFPPPPPHSTPITSTSTSISHRFSRNIIMGGEPRYGRHQLQSSELTIVKLLCTHMHLHALCV